MVSPHGKALIISPLWATIISAIMIAGMIGAFTFAWDANAEITRMKDTVRRLEDAKIGEQLAVLNAYMLRQEQQNREMNQKLDRLLERK